MSARPIDEPHRAASQLELLFGLVFVVAVAAATAQLAHRIADGHALTGIAGFLQVFFAIWWAWMNFTWFASSCDTDDVAYRLLTMVQMAGVLVLAAGVPATAVADYRAVTAGYLVMRIGLVAQWLRAGLEGPARRRTAFRYATGITVLQIGWVGWLLLGETGVLSPVTRPVWFLALVAAELAVPRWAERTVATHLPISPLVISYAVAVSVGVFLVLLWLVHVPVVATTVLRPRAVLACATVVFLLPLAAPWTGVAVVVAGIAAACALLVAFTITLERRGNPS